MNPHLPLLDEEMSLKSAREVSIRALILYALLCGVIGNYPKKVLLEWIEANELLDKLEPSERKYFLSRRALCELSRDQLENSIEALNALLWILGKVKRLEFDKYVEDNMASKLPDIEKGEPANGFLDSVKLRTPNDVLQKCDLAYCIHWALVDCKLKGMDRPGKVSAYVVLERRRALEWAISPDSWDELELDT